MSSRCFVVYCKDENINFKDFKKEVNFEKLLKNEDLLKEEKEYEEIFNDCVKCGVLDPCDDLDLRSFCSLMIEYCSEKGVPLFCFDISSWDPILILISEKIDQYIKNPEKDLKKRFPSYMIKWAKQKIKNHLEKCV